MKVEPLSKLFQPILVTIETKEELATLVDILGSVSVLTDLYDKLSSLNNAT